MQVFHATPVNALDFDVRTKLYMADVSTLEDMHTEGRIKFDHVADVKDIEGDFLENLEHAFQATNTIETAWYRSTAISFVGPCRSTSVGDIIMHEDVYYAVMPTGFARTEIKPEAA